jgi:hypothetical protein
MCKVTCTVLLLPLQTCPALPMWLNNVATEYYMCKVYYLLTEHKKARDLVYPITWALINNLHWLSPIADFFGQPPPRQTPHHNTLTIPLTKPSQITLEV